MKTDYKNTKAFERFSRFLEQIKLAIPDDNYLEDSFEVDNQIIEEDYPEESLDYEKLFNSI